MKATGIVRRIDDLGRIVIPKEIRRTMRIREGDPLEIYTGLDGELVFKKYSMIGELSEFAGEYCEALNKCGGLKAVIFDRDGVIACAGLSKKEHIGLKATPEIEALFEKRSLYSYSGDERQIILHNSYISVLMPIIVEGDVIGAVASLKDNDAKVTESEQKLIATAASFLAKQLES
ncbi:MAG: stage V sporulation T C-terminal domain-containing protein [Firmicutes bacterium]|nr:stage V sporulation T C-terminal domain-containing protein [Bacillota bacterium]